MNLMTCISDISISSVDIRLIQILTYLSYKMHTISVYIVKAVMSEYIFIYSFYYLI